MSDAKKFAITCGDVTIDRMSGKHDLIFVLDNAWPRQNAADGSTSFVLSPKQAHDLFDALKAAGSLADFYPDASVKTQATAPTQDVHLVEKEQ